MTDMDLRVARAPRHHRIGTRAVCMGVGTVVDLECNMNWERAPEGMSTGMQTSLVTEGRRYHLDRPL